MINIRKTRGAEPASEASYRFSRGCTGDGGTRCAALLTDARLAGGEWRRAAGRVSAAAKDASSCN